jgi:hypothetical protein
MKMALFCTKFRHRLDKESNEYKWISSFDIGSEPSAYSCSHLQKDAEDVNPMNICQEPMHHNILRTNCDGSCVCYCMMYGGAQCIDNCSCGKCNFAPWLIKITDGEGVMEDWMECRFSV